MAEQAPNIEPGKGRLVYDKERRTIVGQQAKIDHPLEPFGYRRPPHRLWRFKPLYSFVAATMDIWLIITGRLTLHRAWQAGYDQHIRDECARRARGGN